MLIVDDDSCGLQERYLFVCKIVDFYLQIAISFSIVDLFTNLKIEDPFI